MIEWPKVKDDVVTKVGWRTLVVKTFALPDGREVEYATKESLGNICCAVLALTKDNKVVIAKQYRPGPEKVMMELPGGGAHKGEDPQVSAMREFFEETGYSSDEVSYLGKVVKDAYSNSTHYYYLALNSEKTGEPELDDTEFIDVELITIKELFDNARNTRMTDAEAVFLAYELLKERE